MPQSGIPKEEQERLAQDQALQRAESLLRSGRSVRRSLSFDGLQEIPEIPASLLVARFGTANPVALRLAHSFRTPQRRRMAEQLGLTNVAQGNEANPPGSSQIPVPTGNDSSQHQNPQILNDDTAPVGAGAPSQGNPPPMMVNVPAVAAPELAPDPGAQGMSLAQFQERMISNIEDRLESFQMNFQASFQQQLLAMDDRYARREEVQGLRAEVRALSSTVERLQIAPHGTLPAPMGMPQAPLPAAAHTPRPVGSRHSLGNLQGARAIASQAPTVPIAGTSHDEPDDGQYIMPPPSRHYYGNPRSSHPDHAYLGHSTYSNVQGIHRLHIRSLCRLL